MKYVIAICTLALCSLIPAKLYADEHEHQRNEIGVSGGAIYDSDHSRWGGGVHVHYFRKLHAGSRWALGGGLEQVWDDDRHFTLGIGAKFEPVERLELGLTPGVTFFSHDHHGHDAHEHNANAQFSLHCELVYDLFHWQYLHIGPAVDYSWVPSGNDSHIMLGIHVAVCF